MLRPGNAGSNTTADHIAVLTAAIAQVPTTRRKNLLIRADGAGASNGLLEWLTELNTKRGRSVEYSVGFAVTEKVRDAIGKVPEHAWAPATDPDTQFHSVSGLIPRSSPTRRNAPDLLDGSRRRSTAIRIARSRSSSGYFLGAAMTLILAWNESLHQTRHETPPAFAANSLRAADQDVRFRAADQ